MLTVKPARQDGVLLRRMITTALGPADLQGGTLFFYMVPAYISNLLIATVLSKIGKLGKLGK